LALTGALNASITAKMTRTSGPVPMIWSISGPSDDEKFGAGKVAKMENVATESTSPRVIFWACSTLEIASW
jgi:hypothetical protein